MDDLDTVLKFRNWKAKLLLDRTKLVLGNNKPSMFKNKHVRYDDKTKALPCDPASSTLFLRSAGWADGSESDEMIK